MSPDDFAAWYLAALEDIGLSQTADDGGSDSSMPTIPSSLRGWYLAAGNSWLTSAHNRILPADRLRRIDGRIVFAEENQDVVVWAYDADTSDDDPEVWQGQPGPGSQDPIDWYPEELTLSRFLVEMLLHTVAPDPDEP